MQVNEKTTIQELIKNPENRKTLLRYGIRCIGCHASYSNSLEQEAQNSGIEKEELKELIEELQLVE
ncbi:MAG: disulfide oxidoreductase [Candidatus Diapherotrites archaeon]|nr:disulfide oxidoreductase [Candidatus Diapherotrites archaeon]